MFYRLAVGLFVLLHLASCGTTATEIGERTNSMINRQEQAIIPSRGKIVYTSEAAAREIPKEWTAVGALASSRTKMPKTLKKPPIKK